MQGPLPRIHYYGDGRSFKVINYLFIEIYPQKSKKSTQYFDLLNHLNLLNLTFCMYLTWRYEGESVRELHEQMDISEKDYNVFMEVIKESVKVLKAKE